MLYIPWMVIVSGDDVKKLRFKNFDVWAVEGEKLHERVVYQSIGRTPPPPHPIPKKGEKHINTAQNMLYIAWMVIVTGHNVKK